MTQVTREMFPPGYSEEEIWELVNTLPLDFYSFAAFSGLYSRMYGVLTGAEEGPEAPLGTGNTNRLESFRANSCVIQALWRALIGVTNQSERRLHYSLRQSGYYTEEIQFPLNNTMRLRLPGVEKINVQRAWSDVLVTGAVSPFFDENVTINMVGLVPTAEVSREFVEVPGNVYLRGEDNGTYIVDEGVGYQRNATDWLIPIDQNKKRWDAPAVVKAQHRKYVWVTITPPEIPAGATFVPVYKGTKQIIQQYEVTVLDDGDWRFRLPIYALVSPESSFREVNLIRGEFYKLMEEIEFRYWYEESAPLEIEYWFGNQQFVRTYNPATPTLPYMDARLDSNEYGIITFLPQNTTCCTPLINVCDILADCCSNPDFDITRTKVRIHYKTNPDYLSEPLRAQIPQIIDAIAWKVAAELPVESCGCSMERSYRIGEAHQAYVETATNIFSGTTMSRFEYGDLHGQVVWTTVMNNARIFSRPQFPNKRIRR